MAGFPYTFPFYLPNGEGDGVLVRNHVEAALARLAEYIRKKPNAVAVVAAFAAQADNLESCAIDMVTMRFLDSATQAQLDVIGAIVGEPRLGLDDSTYLLHIKARIKLNKTSGTAPELLEVFGLLRAGSEVFTLVEEFPASLRLIVGGQGVSSTRKSYLLDFLRSARAAGINAFLLSNELSPSTTFTLDGTAAQGLDNSFLSSLVR